MRTSAMITGKSVTDTSVNQSVTSTRQWRSPSRLLNGIKETILDEGLCSGHEEVGHRGVKVLRIRFVPSCEVRSTGPLHSLIETPEHARKRAGS